MRKFPVIVVFLAATACASEPPRHVASAARPAPMAMASSFNARILAAHNRERSAMRAAPLVWDGSLAAGAATYAQYLASTGSFRHSDRRARGGVGENLWMGTRGVYSPERMIGNWASEKQWFRLGVFPNVSSTGRWSDVAHYTQVIWSTTTRVGCGIASGRGRDVLVCRYSPAGNIDGRRVA